MTKSLMLIALALLAGCAQTNYQVYEGRDSITDGRGGTKEMIDGYEIWDNGDPPRRYQVIGVATVEDFDNVFGQQRLRTAIANQIRQAGGDAAIVLDGFSQGQSIGWAMNSRGKTAIGSSTGRKQVRYRIVKYLDKPLAAPSSAPSVPVSPSNTWIRS